jgi:hypothetical protein
MIVDPNWKADGRRTALLWLLAVVVFGVLGLFVFLTGHISVVAGRRAAGGKVDAALTNSFLLIVPLGTTELPGLSKARVETIPDPKNSIRPTFRVLFDTEAGPIPMTGFSRGGREAHDELARRINDHLADATTASFTVRHVGSGGFLALPIAAVVAVLAAAIAWIIVRVRRALIPAGPDWPA